MSPLVLRTALARGERVIAPPSAPRARSARPVGATSTRRGGGRSPGYASPQITASSSSRRRSRSSRRCSPRTAYRRRTSRGGSRAAYPSREVCTQLGEAAFSFVSRLLEEDGIFHFFEFEDDRIVTVFGDSSSAYVEVKPEGNLRFRGETGLHRSPGRRPPRARARGGHQAHILQQNATGTDSACSRHDDWSSSGARQSSRQPALVPSTIPHGHRTG
ncbi:contractile injection system protein, VgrG/Pvc8 family [Sorangium cellulosum]|uniref:contractile injection system protein, VgrG/Pvc8 family n=1 Tax=Sorangium cellulosum TaxID=56 RepID=UPI003B8A76AC